MLSPPAWTSSRNSVATSSTHGIRSITFLHHPPPIAPPPSLPHPSATSWTTSQPHSQLTGPFSVFIPVFFVVVGVSFRVHIPHPRNTAQVCTYSKFQLNFFATVLTQKVLFLQIFFSCFIFSPSWSGTPENIYIPVTCMTAQSGAMHSVGGISVYLSFRSTSIKRAPLLAHVVAAPDRLCNTVGTSSVLLKSSSLTHEDIPSF